MLVIIPNRFRPKQSDLHSGGGVLDPGEMH